MVTLNAHFDGKTIVPDEPVAFAPNQKLRITVEPIESIETTRSDPEPRTDWHSLIGIGLPLPENHTPRFTNNEQLWEKDE